MIKDISRYKTCFYIKWKLGEKWLIEFQFLFRIFIGKINLHKSNWQATSIHTHAHAPPCVCVCVFELGQKSFFFPIQLNSVLTIMVVINSWLLWNKKNYYLVPNDYFTTKPMVIRMSWSCRCHSYNDIANIVEKSW